MKSLSPLKPHTSPPNNGTFNLISENSFQDLPSSMNQTSLNQITNHNPIITKLDYSSAIRAPFYPNSNNLANPSLTLTKNKSKYLEKTKKSNTNLIVRNLSENDIPTANQDQETEEEMFGCAHHNNSKILLHCSDCDMPLCLQCMKTHHQDKKKHEYIEINELKEKISKKAQKDIEVLNERVQNLEPEFNLDEIQTVGLKTISESKEKLMKIIDDFYEELIKNYNSLTYKKPIFLQKTAIVATKEELKVSLEKFTKPDFHINLIADYFSSKYGEKIQDLEENIVSFQMKIKKEFRRLPSIKKNCDVLKEFQDMLLNYTHISFGGMQKAENKPLAQGQGSGNEQGNKLRSSSLMNLASSSVFQLIFFYFS